MTGAAQLDVDQPHASFVEDERAESGELFRTATILLKNRRCPWRCNYCDLWRNALEFTVPRGAIPAQIDEALNNLRGCRQLKLYNAGSFFDRAAIPPEDFPDIAERARRFERVIIESHPALVGAAALRFRDLLGNTELEVAMGLEVADDMLLRRMNKRMTLALFRRAAEFLREAGIAMRAFVIVKPPFVTAEEQGIELANASARFAFECGADVVSLIPARFGTDELSLLAQRGEFSPPTLGAIETVFEAALQLRRGRVFIDLWNIELFSTCSRCFAKRRERLVQMNEQQEVLARVACECARGAVY